MDRKSHWENIYSTKKINEVSWYQPNPEIGLNLIEKYSNGKNDNIIDVGAGDSFLPDFLVEKGYSSINVLDISANAIQRAQQRLGDNASKINWIISDVTEFSPNQTFQIWYDRAAFHFLTDAESIRQYYSNLLDGTDKGSIVIIGTFSENGPLKCSGIEIKQYSKDDMITAFEKDFELVEFINTNHDTPFDTVQNFNFGVFRRTSVK